MGNGLLAVASDKEVIEAVFDKQTPISQSGDYERVWKSFAEGMSPTLYVDVDGLISVYRRSLSASQAERFDEAIQYVGPVQFVAGASAQPGENVTRSTFIFFYQE